jgi:enterobactin synthetase component D
MVLVEPDQAELPGWEELHPAEREWLADRAPRRLRELVAGRSALRRALVEAGWSGDQPLLAEVGGGPQLPPDFTGSISHKAGQAMAVGAPARGRTLGVDTEVLGGRDRRSIAERVLRPSELARWQDAGAGWPALLQVFSIKEAVYKALHPWVGRYVGFGEAEVQADGRVHLHLAQGEGPFQLRSMTSWEGDRLIAVVEVRPTSPGAVAPTP